MWVAADNNYVLIKRRTFSKLGIKLNIQFEATAATPQQIEAYFDVAKTLELSGSFFKPACW